MLITVRKLLFSSGFQNGRCFVNHWLHQILFWLRSTIKENHSGKSEVKMTVVSELETRYITFNSSRWTQLMWWNTKYLYSLKRKCKGCTDMDDWQSGISCGLLKIGDCQCEMAQCLQAKRPASWARRKLFIFLKKGWQYELTLKEYIALYESWVYVFCGNTSSWLFFRC